MRFWLIWALVLVRWRDVNTAACSFVALQACGDGWMVRGQGGVCAKKVFVFGMRVISAFDQPGAQSVRWYSPCLSVVLQAVVW